MLETTRHGTGAAAELLRNEAEVLAATDIRGLPTVVSLEDDHDRADDGNGDGDWTGPHSGVGSVDSSNHAGTVDSLGCTLTTAVPAGVPLRDKAPLPPTEAAGIVLAVAAIARELADAGIRRNPFQAEQVHLAGGTRPVLRHLAGARFGGPGEPGASDLGRLLHLLLPPPGRRPRWALGRDASAALRRVAHRASDPAVSLATFTGLVREAAPNAHLPRPIVARAAQSKWTARRFATGGAVSAVVVALTSAGLAVVSAGGEPRPPAREDSAARLAAPPSSTTTAVLDAAAAAEAVWPKYGCPDVEGTVVEVEGERCPVAITAMGTTIAAGQRAWQVRGEGRYVTAAGDWHCTGRTSVAALDLDTGDIWLFDSFATADGPTTAAYVGRATGAVAIGAPDGCGVVSALDPDGTPIDVDTHQIEEITP